MKVRSIGATLLAFTALMLFGCSSDAPATSSEKAGLHDDVAGTITDMQSRDDGLRDLMTNRSAGYAVFPSVGKGGLIVGGAYGKGEVYQNGRLIGYTELSQGTVGAQIGGQTYSELIVFKDQDALNRFTAGNFEFSGNASAVALKSGAATTAKFEHGIAVFTMPRGGAMLEASIGGQKFSYQPVSETGGPPNR